MMQSSSPLDPVILQARHRALFEHVVDLAIITTDPGGLVTGWGAGAARLLGWPAADMLDDSLDRVFDADGRAAQRPAALLREALRAGRAVDECWHVRPDGSRLWACTETIPLRDAAGAHLGFLTVLHDRTEQHLAAERHRADAEFTSRMLAASGDCIKVLDLDGRLLLMSENGQRLMEVGNLDAIIGCPWPDFWQGAGNDAAKAALSRATTGSMARFEGGARTLAGTPRWWDVQVTPMLGADGLPEKVLVVSRDITDARAASIEIGRLAGLVEQSNDFISITDPDGRLLFVNPAGRRLAGLADDAGLGQDAATLFMPEAQGTVLEHVLPALQRDGHWAGELDLRHVPTEAAIPVLHTVFPLRDAGGAVSGYGTVTRDLRTRRRADAMRMALLELGDRMHALSEPEQMAFAAASVMGRALGVDRAGYGTIGPDGRTLVVERDWTAPGCASAAGAHAMRQYRSYIDMLRRGETIAVTDIRLDARALADQPALERIGVRAMVDLPVMEHGQLVALFYIHHGQPRAWTEDELGFVGDVAARTRDAIERRRAEQQLRALAGALEQQVAERTRERDRVWQVSQDLLGVSDLDGRWISINPAWHALLGWSEADILGRTGEWLEHPDDHAATRAALARLATGARTLGFEQRYRTQDGRYRWLSWTAVPDHDRLYCVGRDVTVEKEAGEALRHAEERLRQSQKMEAVGQLTGGLAHDFNNLLTGIGGSLELLGTRIAQGRLAETGRYIAAAQDAARRAAALTHRLLAFSRRQTLDPQAVDVNRLVTGMEELIQRTVGPGVRLEMIAAPDLWTALVDASQLENVLLNLCINARDAMPEGGRITIETANIEAGERGSDERQLPPGQCLSLRVTDTGTGMTPDTLARAFEPFFTTKPQGEGTGLGLSMIYGFARQSGGMVEVRSEVGLGTSMCLTLPRHHGTVEAENRPDLVPAVTGNGETVLVVDDEATVRLLLCEGLRDLGYRTIEATDGPAALRLLQSDVRIDLLVTDVGMPGGLNGRQVADAGRLVRPGLKVLFVTGYAETEAVGDGTLASGMRVLTKPFGMEALAKRVQALLAEPAPLQQRDLG